MKKIGRRICTAQKNEKKDGSVYMGKFRKKTKEAAAVLALSAVLCAVPVMAGGNCDYWTGDPEDECELNWGRNAEEHWCYCMIHVDENGEAPIVYGPESHTYDEEGRCGCGMTREKASEALAENSESGEPAGTAAEEEAVAAEAEAGQTAASGITRFVLYMIGIITFLFK